MNFSGLNYFDYSYLILLVIFAVFFGIKGATKSISYSLKLILSISLPFIFLGMIISVYHYFIQWFPSDDSCDLVNCSSPYLWELGFISIPLMAFFNFFGLLLIIVNQKILSKK